MPVTHKVPETSNSVQMVFFQNPSSAAPQTPNAQDGRFLSHLAIQDVCSGINWIHWGDHLPYFWNSHSPLSKGHTCHVVSHGQKAVVKRFSDTGILAGMFHGMFQKMAPSCSLKQFTVGFLTSLCWLNPPTTHRTQALKMFDGPPVSSSAIVRYNGNGRHDCTHPRPPCIPHLGSEKSTQSYDSYRDAIAIFGVWVFFYL